MEGFTESERRGFLGKVINILDHGIDMSEYTPDAWGDYKNIDKQDAITKIFSKGEFVMLINKINKCHPNTFINHSFQNQGNAVKMFDYLIEWRTKYFQNNDMSGFLCGMIGNIRNKRVKIVNNATSRIAYKTNDDVTSLIEGYLKGGVKFIKKKEQKELGEDKLERQPEKGNKHCK